ncbi:hypothetical protein E4K72_15270 [Oxalobacteraceae bacterium OM1]|nr:hypothetical protein E4K72_15270 [Oxalobacteraceae bacterium OM1]
MNEDEFSVIEMAEQLEYAIADGEISASDLTSIGSAWSHSDISATARLLRDLWPAILAHAQNLQGMALFTLAAESAQIRPTFRSC